MSAVKLNLQIEQNASFSKVLVWKNSAQRPINLNGFTAKMQIRAEANQISPLILELSTANSRIVIDALQGKITLKIEQSVLQAITVKSAFYDLLVTDSLGKVARLVEGQVKFSSGLTVI